MSGGELRNVGGANRLGSARCRASYLGRKGSEILRAQWMLLPVLGSARDSTDRSPRQHDPEEHDGFVVDQLRWPSGGKERSVAEYESD